jgi:Beta-lactamase
VVGASGPHVLRGGGWQPGWQLQDFDLPAGGLISCTRDLLRWARFQLGDGRAPDGTALLPRESLLRMQTETHGAGCNDDAVGLAWLLRDHGGERFFGHTGQTIGYLSEILLRRERGFALVVLTNALADGGFRRDLVERVLAGTLGLDARPPVPCPDPPARLDEYVGTWRGPFALESVRAGDAPGVLVVESSALPPRPGSWTPPPPPPSRWAFYAPDRLVALEPEGIRGARAEFVRGEDGKVAWFRRGGRVAPPAD